MICGWLNWYIIEPLICWQLPMWVGVYIWFVLDEELFSIGLLRVLWFFPAVIREMNNRQRQWTSKGWSALRVCRVMKIKHYKSSITITPWRCSFITKCCLFQKKSQDLLVHQVLSTLIHLPIQFLRGVDPLLSLDFDAHLLLCYCALESGFDWRLITIKVRLELELCWANVNKRIYIYLAPCFIFLFYNSPSFSISCILSLW